MDRTIAARLGRVAGRRVRHHRDVLGRARCSQGRDPQDARPDRPAVRGQHRPGVRPRSGDRRVRDRSGHQVRHHVGRLADQVHRRAEGGRSHRLPRRAHAGRRAEGGRCRRRRTRGRRRRGRRLQEPDAGVDDGAAAARAFEGRRADHRGGWDHRRRHDGGGVRARRRGRPDGHPDGVGGRVAGASQLEAGDHRRRRDRHAVPQPAPLPRAAGAAHRSHRGTAWTPSTTCSATSATHSICTSAAT